MLEAGDGEAAVTVEGLGKAGKTTLVRILAFARLAALLAVTIPAAVAGGRHAASS